MKILSGILILITLYLNVKHGWSGITMNLKPEEAKMFADIGIGKNLTLCISFVLLAISAMILIPQTFFIANLLNAAIVLLIMAMALHAGVIKTALMEIPFLLMPLVIIWLGYPFKK